MYQKLSYISAYYKFFLSRITSLLMTFDICIQLVSQIAMIMMCSFSPDITQERLQAMLRCS